MSVLENILRCVDGARSFGYQKTEWGAKFYGRMLDRETGHVLWLPRWQPGPVLRRWPSIRAMLDSESERLSRLFDSTGHLLNPKNSTLPSVDAN